MEGSKFREILTDHVDDNGAVHMDGYKTGDPNEEGVVIAVVINGEPYWRNPEDQFDPYVKEELAAIQKQQAEEREELKKKIRQRIQDVFYTGDAKPRPEFVGPKATNLTAKLSLIEAGAEDIMKLL
jgi:hypothetical protein